LPLPAFPLSKVPDGHILCHFSFGLALFERNYFFPLRSLSPFWFKGEAGLFCSFFSLPIGSGSPFVLFPGGEALTFAALHLSPWLLSAGPEKSGLFFFSFPQEEAVSVCLSVFCVGFSPWLFLLADFPPLLPWPLVMSLPSFFRTRFSLPPPSLMRNDWCLT